MSLCQTNNSSCGACCGIFNLDYSFVNLRQILEYRTEYFSKNVKFNQPQSIISYRETFEKKEESLVKKDSTIYNCPFLGFIESNKKKIGCMIHPEITGDPKSQNFSFYGSSICQSYDCKNKERGNVNNWETFFDSIALNFSEYSNLAGNHILASRVEDFFLEANISIDSMFTSHLDLLKRIFLHFIKRGNSNITSFEIDMNFNSFTTKFDSLIDSLELTSDHELFLDLQNLNKTGRNK